MKTNLLTLCLLLLPNLMCASVLAQTATTGTASPAFQVGDVTVIPANGKIVGVNEDHVLINAKEQSTIITKSAPVEFEYHRGERKDLKELPPNCNYEEIGHVYGHKHYMYYTSCKTPGPMVDAEHVYRAKDVCLDHGTSNGITAGDTLWWKTRQVEGQNFPILVKVTKVCGGGKYYVSGNIVITYGESPTSVSFSDLAK